MRTFNANIELFPGKAGWHYVRVPQRLVKDLPVPPKWQFIKVNATVGGTTWKTSLLPYGDGSQFLAIKKDIRKKENLAVDDTITVNFEALLND